LHEEGELVIVPHGPLALVPFAVLPAGANAAPLGAERSVRYTPSLEILRRVTSRPDRRASVGHEPSLVIGNPIMPSFVDSAGIDIDLAPLRHTESEADSVAKWVSAVPLIGARATEAEVRRRIPTAVVVHLATHGYAYTSEARTRESFVALAASEENGIDFDGHLTVGEVLDELKPLTAELVVLSACQSGLGNLKQAEGTIGLQRAFLARGARSVLVSLWSVPDQATSLLMQHFYAYWLGNDRPSKAEALRLAQADLRKTYPHPWYWAAFQLVGAR
jgi:CHAT domain-containing protein